MSPTIKDILQAIMTQAPVSEEVPLQAGYSDKEGTYDEYGTMVDYRGGLTPTLNVAEPRGDLRTNQLVQDSEYLDSLMKNIYPMIFGGEAGKGSDAFEKIENENTLKQYLYQNLLGQFNNQQR